MVSDGKCWFGRQSRGERWNVCLPAKTKHTTGRYYRLCIDADGTTSTQIPGDTGVTVTWRPNCPYFLMESSQMQQLQLQVYMTPVVSGPISTILYGAATEVEVEGCSLAQLAQLWFPTSRLRMTVRIYEISWYFMIFHDISIVNWSHILRSLSPQVERLSLKQLRLTTTWTWAHRSLTAVVVVSFWVPKLTPFFHLFPCVILCHLYLRPCLLKHIPGWDEAGWEHILGVTRQYRDDRDLNHL